MTLQSIWCIDSVGEITINDLNLWLESVIVVPTMTLDYVQFRDFVILWCLYDFLISWSCDIMVDKPWWSVLIGTFACLENCEFGMSWFLQPWPPSNLRACEFGCCSWGTTTWNPSFTLFETKLAGIDTFRCLRTGSKFCQSRLVCTTWICWNQFWQTEFVTYFVLTERVWTHYFGGTKIVWTAVWTEFVAVWGCQRLFPVTVCRWRLLYSIGCCLSPNDDICHSTR